jgi:S1-C subfamily serine protease
MAVRRLGAAFAVTLVAAGVTAGAAWWTLQRPAAGGRPVASVAGATLERSAELAEVDQRVRPSIHRVETTACGVNRQGTASAVEWDGRVRVLTNRHVVAGSSTADVVRGDGTVGELEVAGRVDRRDAAVLSGDTGPALPIGPRPIVGASVAVVGYPGGSYRVEAGSVVSVERRQGYGGTTDMLIVDVEAVPGVSGGLVVDADGRAVGLVAARDPESHFTVAYPIDAVGSEPIPGPPDC